MNATTFTRSTDPEIGTALQCEYADGNGLRLIVSADAQGVRLSRWGSDCYVSQRLTPAQAGALAGELLACVAAHHAAIGGRA